MKTLIAVLALALSAFAQDSLPTDYVAGGLFYNAATSPATSGWGIYGHKVSDVGGGIYSFSMVDVTVSSVKLQDLKVTPSSGFGYKLLTFGVANVFVTGTAGVSTPIGATVGGNGATVAGTAGVLAVLPIGKKGWTLAFPVRVIAGSGPPQYVGGIGLGWGK